MFPWRDAWRAWRAWRAERADRACGQSVSTAQGNNARMQEKNSGMGPVVWVADMRYEGVDCRQNTRTQECKKCAKVEEILYLYGVKMYKGGGKDGNTGAKWRIVP